MNHNSQLILVAEDDEIYQLAIQRQLIQLGYSVDISSDGLFALQKWREGSYAILITDLDMPRMNGYQLSATIRDEERRAQNAKPIPIITLTAKIITNEVKQHIAVHIDDIMIKPVGLTELKAMLEKWLPSVRDLNSPAQLMNSAIEGPVDISVLENLTGNDSVFAQELLQIFRENAFQTTAAVRDACIKKEVLAANTAAHKLKSAARLIGALKLGDLCEHIEEATSLGQLDKLTQLLPVFEKEVADVKGYLDL